MHIHSRPEQWCPTLCTNLLMNCRNWNFMKWVKLVQMAPYRWIKNELNYTYFEHEWRTPCLFTQVVPLPPLLGCGERKYISWINWFETSMSIRTHNNICSIRYIIMYGHWSVFHIYPTQCKNGLYLQLDFAYMCSNAYWNEKISFIDKDP